MHSFLLLLFVIKLYSHINIFSFSVQLQIRHYKTKYRINSGLALKGLKLNNAQRYR